MIYDRNNQQFAAASVITFQKCIMYYVQFTSVGALQTLPGRRLGRNIERMADLAAKRGCHVCR